MQNRYEGVWGVGCGVWGVMRPLDARGVARGTSCLGISTEMMMDGCGLFDILILGERNMYGWTRGRWEVGCIGMEQRTCNLDREL